MKFKKIFFVICLFFVILSFSCVSAENNESVVDNGDVGTFDQLNNEITLIDEGQTLNLEKDYINNESNSAYKSGIQISKSITIDGQGHKIDANKHGRIFYINSGNVCLKNINFINGKYNMAGGSIVWKGNNATIINCNFSNSVSQAAGGAIMHNGKNASLHNTIFYNNTANEDDTFRLGVFGWEVPSGEYVSQGGALSSYGENLLISNSIFANNHAKTGNDYYRAGNTIIINSKFNLTSLDCFFKDLSKKINDTNNVLILDKDYYAYNESDTVLINKSITIIGNGYKLNGCNVSRIFKIMADNVTLINITFINAFSNSNGGAIYWMGNNGKIINCTFEENSVNLTYFGGAIYWCGNNATVDSSKFQ